MPRLPVALATALVVAAPGAALAQKAVIVVRHCANDGDRLTETGAAQATRLASALGSTGVAAVYSTNSQRTIATATPLAEARKLKIETYDTADGQGGFDARPFVARLRKEHPDDVILVVGHVTTIPDLVKAFGGPADVPVPPLDYDDLYILVPAASGGATFLRVKY